jgi:dysferlin
MPEEQSLVIMKKDKFWSLDKTETKLPPVLVLQIWDNDKFSADDFLGSIELNLNSLPMPAKTANSCTLDMLPTINKTSVSSPRTDVKLASLFEQKRLRGFWPCSATDHGQQRLTGKIEMELELVSEAESKERPVGRARDEPNQHPTLELPKRPETSFLWFASPWKTFRLIIWRRYRIYFIVGLILLLVLIFVILFVYAIPSTAVQKMFGS